MYRIIDSSIDAVRGNGVKELNDEHHDSVGKICYDSESEMEISHQISEISRFLALKEAQFQNTSISQFTKKK